MTQTEPNQAGGILLMTSHCACPIWEATSSVQDIPEVGIRHTSSRAGGRFVLKQSGAARSIPRQLKRATPDELEVLRDRKDMACGQD